MDQILEPKFDCENAREMINELPMDEDLLDLAKHVRSALKDKFDSVICISGSREGIGKSTFSMLFGYLVDPYFDLEKNIAYLPTYEEMESKFNALHSRAYFDVDEAIRVLYKMNWMNKLQQQLVQMYATERKQCKATGLCIPRIRDLTEQFRNHKVHLIIHVVSRGYAVSFTRDDYNWATDDPWNLRETDKLLRKLARGRRIHEMSLEDRVKCYKKIPSYMGDFVFPNLPKPIRDEYQRIGALKRRNLMEQRGILGSKEKGNSKGEKKAKKS